MQDMSRRTAKKSWQPGRQRVSVLAEMALRRERIVERLGELRERDSLTQEQAAHRVGVTHRQWQRWESGQSVPYPRNLDLIATSFGISVQEFFDGEPDNQSQLDRIESELAGLRADVSRLLQLLGTDHAAAVDDWVAGTLTETAALDGSSAAAGTPSGTRAADRRAAARPQGKRTA